MIKRLAKTSEMFQFANASRLRVTTQIGKIHLRTVTFARSLDVTISAAVLLRSRSRILIMVDGTAKTETD